MRKKLVISIIVVVLVAAAAALFGSPYVVLNRLKDAADRHDALTISSYIDYPQVRDHLKASLRDKMQQRMGAQSDNPLASFALSIGGWISDRLVEAFLTPDNIAALLRGSGSTPLTQLEQPPSGAPPQTQPSATPHEPTPSAGTSASQAEASDEHQPRAKVDTAFADFNHFLIRVHRRDAPDQVVTFVLTRQGIVGWKLTEIRLPPDA